MATLAETPPPRALPRDERFFLVCALLMTLVMVAGFSTQLAAGRSTFAAPPLVHAHAIVFFGWVFLYLAQNFLVSRDAMRLHRGLGWIGVVWVVPMVVLGIAVIVAMARRGHVPFIFRPIHFLVFDTLTLFAFAGLTYAAVAMRRRTDWHRRLHFCGMTMLLGPGFGRLLPMPLLIPWAWEATVVFTLLFPLAGMIRDRRRSGVVHPAWYWGVGTILGTVLLIEAISFSPLGPALYELIVAGSPGAAVPPLDFQPPPAGPLMTGR